MKNWVCIKYYTEPSEGVPTGLQELATTDKLTITQLEEVLLNYEANNKYVVKNDKGEQIYYVFEESSCLQRQCCGPHRGFVIHIVDSSNNEVMRVTRPFKCCGGCCYGIMACCDCCRRECQVDAPPGRQIGSLKQRLACCASSLDVKDVQDNQLLTIHGPYCCLACGCRDINFRVTAPTMGKIGKITKRWSGCVREALTDADVFSVSFPMDLDVATKALLLAAALLIDFMEFEQSKQ
ncbi:hypothetical protein Q1695_008186 [Nippostrongylus brasiliensis]|nr:hypothetical protein Q1695_008186 [Nippostrongylus brasiliensis]